MNVKIIAIIVFLIGLGASYFLYIQKIRLGDQLFIQESNNIDKDIMDSFNDIYEVLDVGAEYISTQDTINQATFSKFISDSKLLNNNQEIAALGYTKFISRNDLSKKSEILSSYTGTDFVVFPAPSGEEDISPILFIEPNDTINSQSVGYNLFIESNRRKAMELANKTQDAVVSHKLLLITDIGKSGPLGVNIYEPVYDKNQKLDGYFFARINMSDFIQKTVSTKYTDIDLKIFERSDSNLDSLLYSSVPIQTTTKDWVMNWPKTTLRSEITLKGNLIWYIDYSTTKYSPINWNRESIISYLATVIISLLIFLGGTTLQRKNRKIQNIEGLLQKSNIDYQDFKTRKSALLNAVKAGVIAVDGDGNIIETNNSLYELPLFQETADEAKFRGTKFVEILYQLEVLKDDPQLPKLVEAINEVVYTKVSSHTFELSLITNQNSSWYQVTITAFPVEQGGAVITISDISELKNLQKQREDFIGVASHELKTPLTTIKAYGQILSKKLKNDENLSKYTDRINTQVDRLTFLISQLLDVSRLVNGKLTLNKSSFNITELVRNISSDYKLLHENEITIHADRDIFVDGDRIRISQVLINLLNNAIKYSEGSKIEIYVIENENFVLVKIKDYGPGISSEHSNKIFERFYQPKGATNNDSGLGVGLYISKQIIDLHNGIIGLEPREDRGATFYFSLPLTNE
ncbi:MAG: hypothetical protein QG570_252 [Patescibacteria group bacterium]|nr:hypothetical protein [Patescibacteria group bacterium]